MLDYGSQLYVLHLEGFVQFDFEEIICFTIPILPHPDNPRAEEEHAMYKDKGH